MSASMCERVAQNRPTGNFISPHNDEYNLVFWKMLLAGFGRDFTHEEIDAYRSKRNDQGRVDGQIGSHLPGGDLSHEYWFNGRLISIPIQLAGIEKQVIKYCVLANQLRHQSKTVFDPWNDTAPQKASVFVYTVHAGKGFAKMMRTPVEDRCPRCNGYGHFHQFEHVYWGLCYRCGGHGSENRY
ncbi:MAG: hypothetical protein AAGD96_31375 [Chloroflexota bacterium]